jgi:hypothetical protein
MGGRSAMSTHLKRRLLVGLVGVVALVFVAQAHVILPTSVQAAERHFDERDLNGEYAGGITGASSLGIPKAGVLRVVADGAGNLTLETRRNSGGTFVFGTPQQCSYVIESSGFGTVTCPLGTIHLVLSDGGKQFDVVLQGDVVAGGHFIQQ